VFIYERVGEYERLAFHPNVNDATLIISRDDLIRFITYLGNTYEFIKMYD